MRAIHMSGLRTLICPAWSVAACALLIVSGGLGRLFGASPRVVISASPGYRILWDGNNGGFSSPDTTAGPAANAALASNGTVPFTSSDLGPLLGLPFHIAGNLNDGRYGNANSWISGGDSAPYAALRFPAAVNMSSIAWGRDNGNVAGDCCGGTLSDRTIGTYTLQYTTAAAPDGTTAETGDAATGWETIGTIQYLAGTDDGTFAAYLRHRYDVGLSGGAPISATGLRIKVSDGGIDIDEIEVNPPPDPIPPITQFVEATAARGYAVTWDRNEGKNSTDATPAPAPRNAASLSQGTTAFGSSQLDFGVHFIRNVNDGLYGNAHSWIALSSDPNPYVGLNFGRRIALRNLAWGRDNGDVAGDCCGGTLRDRTLGAYQIQVTTLPNPGINTPDACGPDPDSGWVTIATVNYKQNDLTYFNSHLRHRFDLSRDGNPIAATGIRLKVPNNSIAIDEIEVNSNLALENNLVRITNAPGVNIRWDGNDGHFNNAATDAAPPDNRALATKGTIPFTSSDLGVRLGIPFHRAVNLNDGRYGNANSWISDNGLGGTSDPGPFAGLRFDAAVMITNIAWGRDNGNVAGDCCGGTLSDRSLDTYTLQFTMTPAPDASVPETGDAATGWQDLGTITFIAAAPPDFTPYLRHRFDLGLNGSAVEATGLRIKVANGATAIDEIEVNTPTTAPPPPSPVLITARAGYGITWDGNDGQFRSPAAGAAPPPNRALASAGSTSFTSSDLGPVLGIPFHVAANINDGLYGNAHSWISANGIGGSSDPNPFFGVRFGALVTVANLAWGRDNGDDAEGVFTDRALGTYTIQVTAVSTPDASTPDTDDAATGWATVGTVQYLRAQPPDFTPHLRHRFDVSSAGHEIEATGIRVKVSDGSLDVDELEVNTALVSRPVILIGKNNGTITISWTGGGGLESAAAPTGPWECVGDATSPYALPSTADKVRFYRIRK